MGEVPSGRRLPNLSAFLHGPSKVALQQLSHARDLRGGPRSATLCGSVVFRQESAKVGGPT